MANQFKRPLTTEAAKKLCYQHNINGKFIMLPGYYTNKGTLVSVIQFGEIVKI